jgi:hypothetical protein
VLSKPHNVWVCTDKCLLLVKGSWHEQAGHDCMHPQTHMACKGSAAHSSIKIIKKSYQQACSPAETVVFKHLVDIAPLTAGTYLR